MERERIELKNTQYLSLNMLTLSRPEVQLDFNAELNRFTIPADRYAHLSALVAGRKYRVDEYTFPMDFGPMMQLFNSGLDLEPTELAKQKLKELEVEFAEWTS